MGIRQESLLIVQHRLDRFIQYRYCQGRKKEDDNVKLLVIQKVWPDGTTKYVLPKGHKEGEETLEDTALREVREESGYSDISLLRYLGSATYEYVLGK